MEAVYGYNCLSLMPTGNVQFSAPSGMSHEKYCPLIYLKCNEYLVAGLVTENVVEVEWIGMRLGA